MTRATVRVLLADDDESFRRVQEYHLTQAGYSVTSCSDGDAALDSFREKLQDVVITDIRMPGLDGLELMARLKAISAETPVVIVTGHGTIEAAVEAMRQGAFDFLTKPFPRDRLRLTLSRALEMVHLQQENRELRRAVQSRFSFENLIGSSASMKTLYEAMELVAASPSTVLITGETGTGKELVAQAIHYNSPRRGGSLVTVNCGAIPEALIESELFGYRKGAFTGAHADRKGKFESANGGTLFLDEVGEIHLSLQSKILRVLQSGEVDKVGSDRSVKVDVRIIAATNRDLEAMVKAGEFRDDLYYRLAVVPLHVPPLRERREDIPLLAQHFLGQMAERAKRPGLRFPPKIFALFDHYSWPGNVRELENVIEHLVVMSRDQTLDESLLPAKFRIGGGSVASHFELPAGGVNLEELEKELIRQALARQGGNRTRAARDLGLTRNTLLYRIQKYGMA